MKLAILGGTFNPPHFGHLFFANEVRQHLKLDKVIFTPSSLSAHKTNDKNIESKTRLEMLSLAINRYNWAEVSDCDILRGGITRTIDTINDIKKAYNLTNKPWFILGDDLAEGFSNWKNPDQIAREANLVVGVRSGNPIAFNYPHIKVNNRQFPLSSSEIRDRVKLGLDIDFLLPSIVVDYIKENELYRSC